jgi:asparagine synthase (glutamine-hydrolysing)
MCGITGYINVEGVQVSDIEIMNNEIVHRGPDDCGIFLSEDATAGIGHQRLSIIDLDGGHQPMSNEDETIWITFNGEIYNFKKLRDELGSKHHFKTKSDTEVILHLYEEKGENCVNWLRGMFAFAIYDQKLGKLFLARDHLGQKPLYYYHFGQQFAFASEIKALLALKPELRELDCDALYEYLTIRIITPPRSMFKQIRKLAPGHQLVFRNKQVTVKPYWRLQYEPKLNDDFRSIVNELDRKIQSTVKYHLVSDVPVGAFLSGGLDSSIIVAMMSRVADEDINAFSGDVPYEGFSELPYANIVAKRYQAEHHVLTVKPSLVRSLPDLVWHLDEPSDPLSVCMYYISQLARKKVKVVLGGDGGDELFGGYDRYYGNVLVDYYAMIPENLRKFVFGNLLRVMPESFWYRSYSHQLRWIHQMSFYQGGERYSKSLGYFYFSDNFKQHLYTEKFQQSVGMFDPEASIKKYFDMNNAAEIIDRMLHSDSMIRMPDHPNMILDRMTMAHGLEARSPFLDHKLAEFCASIPAKFKVKGTRRRIVEIELAKKYLPLDLIQKKKQGFSSALAYLLADEFRMLYKIFLNESSLVRDGYFKLSGIDRLLNEHLSGSFDHGNRLWLLCNAEVWYRMHIEQQKKESISELLARSADQQVNSN